MIDTALVTELTDQAAADGILQLVVGAVVDGKKALVLRRPQDDFMGGIYELPGGKVDPGEALDDALTREVQEETGLDVTSIDRYLGHFDYTSGSGKPSRQFNFAVTVKATTPVELTEHDDHRWVLIDGDLPVTEAVKGVFATYRRQDLS
ncbi:MULTISPECIES: NUDIX domain-containing protein [Actinoalloteichus]|uniref:NUDIX family protein n=1 Tax=Actinoalloteichus fjordicus TaxID=1612552 RepID=A0AAC9PTE7_9PSEU|nr:MULTISPECIES: NUDIX domain-containing protein [Actinoalloteichus]APU15967.1 NUDIX family protein [Actinoalloteichus fjordicus]APU22031.1 NUDIX family protein [Actinoalloteichus sp. GBA129-24]